MLLTIYRKSRRDVEHLKNMAFMITEKIKLLLNDITVLFEYKKCTIHSFKRFPYKNKLER